MRKAWNSLKAKFRGRRRSLTDSADFQPKTPEEDENILGGPLYETYADYLPTEYITDVTTRTPKNRSRLLVSNQNDTTDALGGDHTFRSHSEDEMESVSFVEVPTPSILNFPCLTPEQVSSSKVVESFIVPSKLKKFIAPDALLMRNSVGPKPSPTFSGRYVQHSLSETQIGKPVIF